MNNRRKAFCWTVCCLALGAQGGDRGRWGHPPAGGVGDTHPRREGRGVGDTHPQPLEGA